MHRLYTGHEADVAANEDPTRADLPPLPTEAPMSDEERAIIADFFSGDEARARDAIERSALRAALRRPR